MKTRAKGLLRAVLLVCVAFWGMAAAAQQTGVWKFYYNELFHDFFYTSEPYALVAKSNTKFAAVQVTRADQDWIGIVGLFPDPAASVLNYTVVYADGRREAAYFSDSALDIVELEGFEGWAYVFKMEAEEAEMLKAGSTLEVSMNGETVVFPLKGSRKSIERAERAAAWGKPLPRDTWSEICRAEAAHRWELPVEAYHRNWQKGVEWGELNAEVAIEACVNAINGGDKSAENYYRLGRALDRAGSERSVVYLTQASEMGYAMAKTHLGILHIEKLYGLDDVDYAMELFSAASKKGNVPGSYEHLLNFFLAPSLLKSMADAYYYAPANKTYAELLEDGSATGTPDPERARHYYSRAWAAGSAPSAYRLAEMHRDGVGGPPSQTEYLVYLKRAAKLGHQKASEELDNY
ncbi:hypothetical protein [Aliisedimentitalea sp. MJ-SS2]|uniref:tetratricopeptide repeat protein n=1 Tax=Aliisedimentitalea sp. MJ-SS2 TaxID=3049795 RepID=UPI00292EA89F|nr:hypothetical protein [Alisedimentitalea sp. MJ-SS2]